MTRELKFRAWFPEVCTMSPPAEFNAIVRAFHDVGYDKEIAHQLIYLQYTGLKDRSDVDIYEGDVVRGLADEDWVVEWFDTGWTLRCTCHYPDGDFFELVGLEMQVVGNIYENRELLNDKNN